MILIFVVLAYLSFLILPTLKALSEFAIAIRQTPTSPNTASHIAFSLNIPIAQPIMIKSFTAIAKMIFS